MQKNNQFNAGKTTAGTNIGKVKQANQTFGQEFASEATDVQAVKQANAQSQTNAAGKSFGQQGQQNQQ
jgi:small acid-soluble spore protein E (minor gamma-type SASP)